MQMEIRSTEMKNNIDMVENIEPEGQGRSYYEHDSDDSDITIKNETDMATVAGV